jgi:hypothetical protein
VFLGSEREAKEMFFLDPEGRRAYPYKKIRGREVATGVFRGVLGYNPIGT